MDPGIICFQHCAYKIFCFHLPDKCPACTSDIEECQFSLMPFRIPYPFVRATQYPCSVVIKPTNGDFLNDYYNSMDLHIGVTNSAGFIIEFDKRGLRNHISAEWDQCLLLEQMEMPWREHWDIKLTQICENFSWTAKDYKEDENNCYSFVLSFLRALDYGGLSVAASGRALFCEKFIVGRTTSAGKYISLYRKLKQRGYYIHDKSDRV